MIQHSFKFFGFFWLILFAWFSEAEAKERHVETPQVKIGLSAAIEDASAPNVIWLGVEFEMQPDWKIYWQQPGEGGKPPEFRFEGSENIVEARPHFPKPKPFYTYGFLTYGYDNKALIPLKLVLEDRFRVTQSNFVIDFFICKEICIPDQVTLSWDIPVGEAGSAEDMAHLKKTVSSLPVAAQENAVVRLSSPKAFQGEQAHWRLEWQGTSSRPVSAIEAYFDGGDGVFFSEPLWEFSEDRKSFTLKTQAEHLSPTQPIRVFLAYPKDGNNIYDYRDFSNISVTSFPWGWVLLLAFVGGVIINVMPCVLPVLMLKMFGVLRHDPSEQASKRRSFLWVAGGIVSSFGLLGGVFAILRAGGENLHWGMQFQAPLFLSGMALALTLFAAQLWGWWDLRLPAVFRRISQGKGGLHEFSSGVLASLLATPCSAPFIGVAISTALFVEPLLMLSIFLTMGLGMSLPYLMLALLPKNWLWFPKPGAWMERLKIFLGLSVLVTALWIIWLLSAVIGDMGALSILFIMALVLIVLATKYASDTKIASNRGKLVVLLLVLGLSLPEKFRVSSASESLPIGWQAFKPERISVLVSEGKTVLVDISADWCLTCKVNDQLVWFTPEVSEWIAKDQVVAMRGDWSRPDEMILKFLARYQRKALPFAIVYSPYAPEGILFPELITLDEFWNTLKKVKAKP